jgi:cell wall assembly regulator SMI1
LLGRRFQLNFGRHSRMVWKKLNAMIRWTATTRKKARPGRRGEAPRSPFKAVDLVAARRAIASSFAESAQRWAAGQSEADATLSRRMADVSVSMSSGDWAPVDPTVEGIRAAMLTDWQHMHAGKDVVSSSLVPLWVATRGVSFALASLLEYATLRMRWHVRANKEAGWYLVYQAPELLPTQPPLFGWGALRVELGRTDWPSYQAALALAAANRWSATLALRCALSYAFSTERHWVAEDARECLAAKEFPAYGTTLLVAEDVDLCVEIARRRTGAAADYLYTLIDVLGEAAVRPLALLLGSQPDGIVVRALTLIETEAAAAVLVDCLATPKVRRLVATYLLRAPRLAVPALARAFARPTAPGREAAATVYAGLLAAHGADVADAIATLSADERHVLRELEGVARSEAAARTSPVRVAMREAWNRVETWLQKHHPDKTEMLAPGATLSELAALERGLGFELSEDLRAFLLEHDGESDAAVGLFEGFELMSTDSILDDWTTMVDVTASWGENEGLDPVQGVRRRHWHRGWVSIADDGAGNTFCVDLDPDVGGRFGQVLFRDHEVGPEHVVAPSLLEWLVELAERLKAGRAHVWSDGSIHSEPEE